MTKHEELLLLTVIAAVAVGVVSFSVKAGPSGISASAKAGSGSLRRGLADAYRPENDDGDWRAPKWSILSAGGDVLSGNHPLFRRCQPGSALYRMQCGDWGDWYYNPPSESYF